MNYIDNTTSLESLQDLFLSKQWITDEEKVLSAEKPGEGNMNVVLRVKTNRRSLILKQSRPYVQKYQQIEAPLARISVEYEFYQTVQNENLKKNLPSILSYDAHEHILILEDLGQCEDMTMLYASRKISEDRLQQLTSILASIHKSQVSRNFPENMEMRQLNHQHIFVLPFLENNGFQLDDIQDGLQQLSMPYKKNAPLKAVVDQVGNTYLSAGNTLLHGDYYPGSWMIDGENTYIIDPEFGFVGFLEFDLGVLAAHIIMATSEESYLNTIYDFYKGAPDKKLVTQVAGIEIMRRLIGLAQLPLDRSIEEKLYLLELAQKMIVS